MKTKDIKSIENNLHMKTRNKKIYLNPYYLLSLVITYIFYPLKFIRPFRDNYLPIFKLINNIFVNNHIAGFLAVWYPLIFVGILPQVSHPQYMIFGVLNIIPITIGVMVMPTIIVNLKNSSILKRIGATETKTSEFTLTLLAYFTIVSFISVFINLGLGFAFYGSVLIPEMVNWGAFVIGIFVSIIISTSIGIFISGVVKNEQLVMGIGLLLSLPGAFLTGAFLPTTLINKMGEFVKWFSFIFPQKIGTSLVNMSAVDGNIFNIADVDAKNLSGIDNFNDTIKAFFDTDLIKVKHGQIALNGNMVDIAEANVADWQKYLRVFSTGDADSISNVTKTVIGNVEFKDNLKLSENYSTLFDKNLLITCWALTPVWLVLFIGLSIKFFKWGAR